MKYKTVPEEVPDTKLSDDLKQMFTDLIQLEYNKISLCLAAKIYFDNNGLVNYKKFFGDIKQNCFNCLWKFLSHASHQMEIPSFEIPKFPEFKSKEEPFEMLAELEDDFFALVEEFTGKCVEEEDYHNLSFAVSVLEKVDHIACKAFEAVKNDADPVKLVEKFIFWD